MQIHYDKGVTIHIGPESCVSILEGAGEALTGDHLGRLLSRESKYISGVDAVSDAEGNTFGRASVSVRTTGVVGDPGMCGRSLCGNWEISRLAKSAFAPTWSASGRRGAATDDARP